MDTIAGVEEHSEKEHAEGALRNSGEPLKPRQTVSDKHRRATRAHGSSIRTSTQTFVTTSHIATNQEVLN